MLCADSYHESAWRHIESINFPHRVDVVLIVVDSIWMVLIFCGFEDCAVILPSLRKAVSYCKKVMVSILYAELFYADSFVEFAISVV